MLKGAAVNLVPTTYTDQLLMYGEIDLETGFITTGPNAGTNILYLTPAVQGSFLQIETVRAFAVSGSTSNAAGQLKDIISGRECVASRTWAFPDLTTMITPTLSGDVIGTDTYKRAKAWYPNVSAPTVMVSYNMTTPSSTPCVARFFIFGCVYDNFGIF